VPVAVLVAAIVMESFSFRTAIVESNHARGKASWGTFIRKAKAPELPVILLEDFAALVGLVLALLGVSLTLITGDGVWDGIGTLAIGVLLVAVAVVLAVETKSLLLGESATEEHVDAIVTALEAGDQVTRVIHLRTLHVGPEELLVAAKIGVDHDDRADEIAATINEAEARVRAAVPIARYVYLEPDLYDASRPVPAPLPE
jgi:divalent metal cation (Fe/Co/Zn/Cd) transporter